jgi:hypothetical protein
MKFCLHILQFVCNFDKFSTESTLQEFLEWLWILRKTGAVGVTFCLGASANFCHYFLNVFSNLGEIWPTTFVHNAVEPLCVSWNDFHETHKCGLCTEVQWRPYSSHGCKWNRIYACTMKLYAILKIKPTLVKSVY